jgi:hypothetical protein
MGLWTLSERHREVLTLNTAVSVKNLFTSADAAIAIMMPDRSFRASRAAMYSWTCWGGVGVRGWGVGGSVEDVC